MPTKAALPCWDQRCAHVRPCPVHGNQPAHRALYQRRAWRRLSRAFLDRHPLCAVCRRPAKHTDHVTPHRGDDALAWAEENLQALCAACHARKTRESDR